MTLPIFVTLAVPVKVVPAQQKRYAPLTELPKNTVPGFESSCKQTLNTLMVKLHVAVLPDASVAVQVTVVTPSGKQEPLGGLHTTTTPGQLSEAVVVKLTVAHVLLILGVTAVLLAGQVITGGCVSFTVTVNVQELLWPRSSDTLQVTVVVPTGKNVPLAGEHVAAPGVEQLLDTVGAA